MGVVGSVVAGGLAWSAQRWQLERQLRAEDARWRRQQRRDAYASFLSASHVSVANLVSAVDELTATGQEDRSALEAATAQSLTSLESSIALVRLEGAPEVVDLAEDLWDVVARLYRAVLPWKQGRAFDDREVRAAYRAALDNCIAKRQEFIAVARADLD